MMGGIILEVHVRVRGHIIEGPSLAYDYASLDLRSQVKQYVRGSSPYAQNMHPTEPICKSTALPDSGKI